MSNIEHLKVYLKNNKDLACALKIFVYKCTCFMIYYIVEVRKMRRYAFLLGLTFLIFLLIPDLIYSTTAVLQFRPNIETPWTTVELKLPDEVPNLTSEMIGRKISLSDPKLVALCFCYKYRDISFAYMLVAHRWAAKAIALKDCLKNKFWVCHPSGDWEEVNQYKFNMMITTLKWSDSL